MPKHHHGGSKFGFGALGLGALATAAAGTYKASEALVHLRKLHDVGNNNMVYVRIIERVNIDLAECDRLLALPDVKYALSRSPEKVAWIRKSIAIMRAALQEMARHTARVRKDGLKGKWVGLWNRAYWVLEEHEKLEMRVHEVARGHDGLLQVLAFLSPFEPLACCLDARQHGGAYRQDGTYQQGDTYASVSYGQRDAGVYNDETDQYREEKDVTYREEREESPSHRAVEQRYQQGHDPDEYVVDEDPRYRSIIAQSRPRFKDVQDVQEDQFIQREPAQEIEVDRRVELDRQTVAPERYNDPPKVCPLSYE
jgi:hypothetical protein